MTYELVGEPKIQPEYSDDSKGQWYIALECQVRDESGVVHEISVNAGVPDWHRGQTVNAGHRSGFLRVWTDEEGWNYNNDSLRAHRDEIIEAVEKTCTDAYYDWWIEQENIEQGNPTLKLARIPGDNGPLLARLHMGNDARYHWFVDGEDIELSGDTIEQACEVLHDSYRPEPKWLDQ